MKTRAWFRVATSVALSALVVPVSGAQTRLAPAGTVVGVVQDTAGRALPGVEVRLRGTDILTRTNESGAFRLVNTPLGASQLLLRRLGFEATSVNLDLREGHIDSLIVSLNMSIATLPGMTVEEEAMTRSKRLLAGFWDRRSKGWGHFVTRDEIVDKNPHDFVDIVRMIPGVTTQVVNGRRTIRFNREAGMRTDCPPQYVIDGVPIENGNPDDFMPSDVEAVEIYNGVSTTPAAFAGRPQQRTRTCGTVVIWTRLPG